MQPAPDAAPDPKPELSEPTLDCVRLRDLTMDDFRGIGIRAVKSALRNNVTDSAAALAYYFFLSLPAVLLLSLGLFGLAAGPDTVDVVLERLARVAPASAVELLGESLDRVVANQAGGLVLVLVGGALALWSVTGAMTALMRALNSTYEREDTRSFVRKRLTGLLMFAAGLVAFALSFGALVLGPQLSSWVGSAVGAESLVSWLWWAAQWPVLLAALLVVFAAVLYLGPDVEHPRWQFVTPGAIAAVFIWLASSGLFAVYVSMFGSYNKTWGSLAAVIIMLTWIWVSSLALLIGAEINLEAERSRELRKGIDATRSIQAPHKGDGARSDAGDASDRVAPAHGRAGT